MEIGFNFDFEGLTRMKERRDDSRSSKAGLAVNDCKAAAESTKMNYIFCVWIGSRTELFDLFQNETSALFLVLDLIKLVDDDEKISLLIAGVHEELFCRQGEMILGGNDEDDDVDFFLSAEKSCRLQAVAVETWCVDQGNTDDAIVEKGF